MKRAAMLSICTLIVCAGLAGAQTPVEPIDIAVTGLVYSHPVPGMISLTAHLQVNHVLASSTSFTADVTFYLDGTPVTTVVHSMSVTASACDVDPSCSVLCDASNGANCGQWTTWAGGACDPSAPSGTCQPITICACGFTAQVNTSSTDSGAITATVVYDPNSQIMEADETNNSYTVALAPVPVRGATWGAIKALFEIR